MQNKYLGQYFCKLFSHTRKKIALDSYSHTPKYTHNNNKKKKKLNEPKCSNLSSSISAYITNFSYITKSSGNLKIIYINSGNRFNNTEKPNRYFTETWKKNHNYAFECICWLCKKRPSLLHKTNLHI